MEKIPKDNTAVSALINELQKLDEAINGLQFEQALAYARNSEYEIAEQILCPNGEKPSDLNHLDLLARIFARRGKVDQARQIWEQILILNPNHSNAQAALAYLASKSPQRADVARAIGWALSGVVILTLLTYFLLQTRRLSQISEQTLQALQQLNLTPMVVNIDAQQTPVMLSLDDLAKKEDIQALSNRIDKLSTIILSTPTSQPSIISLLKLNVDGILIVRKGDSLEVIFEEGIFLYERKIGDNGKALLRALALQLKPYISQLQIEVYGFADSSEKHLAELGIQRAVSVVNFLVSETGLPAEAFLVRSSQGIQPPFPNDNQSNRLKNRTVILVILGGKE